MAYKSGLLTTYKSWDDPPSTKFHFVRLVFQPPTLNHSIRKVPLGGFPVPLECEDVRFRLSWVPTTLRTSEAMAAASSIALPKDTPWKINGWFTYKSPMKRKDMIFQSSRELCEHN